MTDESFYDRYRRGLAVGRAGYSTNSKALLVEVMAKLHNKIDAHGVTDTDQIAAAFALGRLLIDPNFPDHWFEEEASA